MKYVIVSVYDRAAQAFGRPVFVQAVGAAVRSFQDEINREAPENEMNRHPDDFDLYEIGSFDDQTGELSVVDHQAAVALGKSLKTQR